VKKIHVTIGALVGALSIGAVAYAASSALQAQAREFDPAKTYLVQADWLNGIGCPTGAKVATYPATSPTGTYTDPACATGDSKDKKNEGLLLAKTGPTPNNASAVADIKGVKGTAVTELGYDIRKPVSSVDPRGSHCGAGAPRFNIELQNGSFYFLGCNSPPPTAQTAGDGYVRLRWGAAGTLMAFNASTFLLENISGMQLKSLSIVFDEGYDTGPDNFGLAVLDNIDVNGKLVGAGGGGHDDDDDDDDKKDDD
jgi:hypothetical protein